MSKTAANLIQFFILLPLSPIRKMSVLDGVTPNVLCDLFTLRWLAFLTNALCSL